MLLDEFMLLDECRYCLAPVPAQR